jgi:glutamine amidotransferase
VGAETIAVSDYVNVFSAALHRDNYYAVQGHPEKSGMTGQRILENFLKL